MMHGPHDETDSPDTSRRPRRPAWEPESLPIYIDDPDEPPVSEELPPRTPKADDDESTPGVIIIDIS